MRPAVGLPNDSPEVLHRFHAELDLVDIIAKQVGRTLGRGIDLDDLRSFGREGLLDAARRYDASRGVPFRAYANFRVRGAVMDGVRSLGQLPRRAHERLRALEAGTRVSEGASEDVFAGQPVGTAASDAERALDEHLAAMATAVALGLLAQTAKSGSPEPEAIAADDPEEAFARAELLHVVREALDELPDQEALLVRRHYLEGVALDAAAKEIGLSKSWASRLHTRAMARLAKRLRNQID